MGARRYGGTGARSDGGTALLVHSGTDVRRHKGMVVRRTLLRRHSGTGARRYGARWYGAVCTLYGFYKKNHDEWVAAFIKPGSPFAENYRKKPKIPAFGEMIEPPLLTGFRKSEITSLETGAILVL